MWCIQLSDFYLEAFNALSDQDFEERPVGIEEFVSSKDFLGLKKLSDHQYSVVRAMSQIYRHDTLVWLYGPEEGERRWRQTCNEIVLQLGKGSGKDFTSTIAVAYVVYLLLCLRDPAEYFGIPSGETIDIINIAINADQALRVFFKNFKNRIEKCPWFLGRYDPKNNVIEFDKNISVYSGHSEREAFEGYNTLIVILDEISGFAMTSTSGHDQAKTAPSIYQMYRGSVTSRFAEFGKLVLLSWPRFENDFIQERYNDVVADKDVTFKEKVLKLDPELPDGTEGNEFTVKWEEDHVLRYKHNRTYALRRPCWDVNPTKVIEMYTRDFYDNMADALGRYACMPSNSSDGFFKNTNAIDDSFIRTNGVDHSGIFHPNFKPKPGTKYYIHVDLAQKHDHCAVALAHVEKWVEVSVGANYRETHPFIVVDAVRWWTPTKSQSVDFKDVIDYIKQIRRAGFELGLVTFDRWSSHDTMKDLERNQIKTDTLSVGKKHYDDFLAVLYDERLAGPNEELLKKELGQLRLVKGKVDHPRKGTKDLSDATCGAIFNAVAHTSKPKNEIVEAHTLRDIRKQLAEEERAKHKEKLDGVIRPPKKQQMPVEIEDYFKGLKIL